MVLLVLQNEYGRTTDLRNTTDMTKMGKTNP